METDEPRIFSQGDFLNSILSTVSIIGLSHHQPPIQSAVLDGFEDVLGLGVLLAKSLPENRITLAPNNS